MGWQLIARLSLLLCLTLSTAAPAVAAGFEILVPHRAVYDVELDQAEQRSGIKAMNGRIVYEITGNECEGISVRFRFVTNISTGSDSFTTDQQTTTHESADGREFSFITKSFVNDVADQVIRGDALQQPGAIEVRLKSPTERDFKLGPGLFVTTHLIEVIEKARQGATFLTHDIFDGSGDADKLLSSSTAIGSSREADGPFGGEGTLELGPLDGSTVWPVSISYFDQDISSSSESLPIYEVSFMLHDNGISRALTMRYPDYSLKAALTKLEFLENPPCELEN